MSGSTPNAPSVWVRARAATLWLGCGLVLTVACAWLVPLALSTRGLGPSIAPPISYSAPTSDEGGLDARLSVRRTMFSDWYVAEGVARRYACPAWPSGAATDWKIEPLTVAQPLAPAAITAPPPEEACAWARIDTRLAGWPFRALASEAWYRTRSDGENGYAPIPTYRWTWHLGAMRGRPVLLPLRPVWPGLVGSTLFWAGATWLLFGWPRARRRRQRREAGLCDECGYALQTAERCPECGTPRPSPPGC